MGQSLASAVPMVDAAEDPLPVGGRSPVSPGRYGRADSDQAARHHGTDSLPDEDELASCRSSATPRESCGEHTMHGTSLNASFLGHSFMDQSFSLMSASGRGPSMRDIMDMADKFETFEFMLDSCISSVLSYGIGYRHDALYEIERCRTAKDRLLKEEEYRRGLINHAMYTVSQIAFMAAQQIMPALVRIAAVDPQEVQRWKLHIAQRSGRAGGPADDAPAPLYDEYGHYVERQVTTIYQKGLQLNPHHRRTGSYLPEVHASASTPPYATPLSSPLEASPPMPRADPRRIAFFSSLSGRAIDPFKSNTAAKITEHWDFHHGTTDDAMALHLNNGDAYFHFLCSPLTTCTPADLDVIQTFVNVSNFPDELRENNCPVLDCFDPEQQALYQVIAVKAMYILPGVRLQDVSKGLLASHEYNKACQPGGISLYDTEAPFTFRQSKPIIKFVFTLIIQFLVGEINDPAVLQQFTKVEGVAPVKAVFLERTKRNISKTDATVKCKSVLLYYPIDAGVLVSHQTVVVNSSIPTIVAKVVNNFGSQGSKESAETADLTRRFLLKKFGDSRSQK